MTLALGRRFIIVDGVERWKDKDLDALEAAIGAIAPDTTVAFFAREDSRSQGAGAAARRWSARSAATSAPEESVKPWELPKWVIARGRELGLELDARRRARPDPPRRRPPAAAAARAREARSGRRRGRDGATTRRRPGRGADGALRRAQGVDAWPTRSSPGTRRRRSRAYLALREQGERRARAPVLDLAARCAPRTRSPTRWRPGAAAGADQAQAADAVARGRPPDRRCAPGGRRAAASARSCEIADLELASRGGGRGGAGEDTAALLSITRIAA